MTDFNHSPGASQRLRLKADGRFRDKPNFLLIVILASLFLVLLLVVAVLFVHWDGRHLMLKPSRQPASTTLLAMPSQPLQSAV